MPRMAQRKCPCLGTRVTYLRDYRETGLRWAPQGVCRGPLRRGPLWSSVFRFKGDRVDARSGVVSTRIRAASASVLVDR